MPGVSTRARWALIATGLVIAFVIAAALIRPGQPEMFPMGRGRGPMTWVIRPGETVTLSADETDPADEYICSGKGHVIGPPAREHAEVNGRLFVVTQSGGGVSVRCSDTPGFPPRST
jgi:hypothetical protein